MSPHHQRTNVSWLDTIAGLLASKQRAKPQRMTRRLWAERLETRNVLSVAPLSEAASNDLSLSEYLSQEHTMGPISPASIVDATAALANAPLPTDHALTLYSGEGEGEGAGSGSGSGGASGSGSGGSYASGSGSGGNAGSGSGSSQSSGSGSGGGSGSGSGTSSASGSGSDETPPDGEAQMSENGDTLTIQGTISDNSGLQGVTGTVGGLGSGTVTINSDGTFSFDMPPPDSDGVITLTFVDGNGNSVIYTFEYSVS